MFVYVVIEDDVGDKSEICGIYSNEESAKNRLEKLKDNNRFPFFSYRMEKIPVWD